MSEEVLRQFLDKLNGDESFRQSVQKDPENAFADFGLSPTEQVALASNDADALRRLAGADVSAFAAPGGPLGGGLGFQATWFSWCKETGNFCVTPDSKRGCGTGNNCETNLNTCPRE